MKVVIGTLLCILGVFFGLYVGVWWAFIGGIIDVIQQIRAPELSTTIVAIGIAKVLFAGLLGSLSGVFLVIPGAAMIRDA